MDILLPKIGFATNEGTIAEWLVADGARVTEGQPLYSMENEKAVEEINAPASGTLRIIAVPGTAYEIGTVLGTIE